MMMTSASATDPHSTADDVTLDQHSRRRRQFVNLRRRRDADDVISRHYREHALCFRPSDAVLPCYATPPWDSQFVTSARSHCVTSRCRNGFVGGRQRDDAVVCRSSSRSVSRSALRSLSRYKERDLWSSSNLFHHVLLAIVLCLSNLCCIQSAPPTFREFSPEHRRVFQEASANSVPFFHTLRSDPHNENHIYVGALDYVYRLHADNIALQHERSANLSQNELYVAEYRAHQAACRHIRGLQNPEIQCRNHVRTLVPHVDRSLLYVCSTGAYSPQEFILNIETLNVLKVHPAASGRAKCPYDPLSVYTFVYVVSGNPYGVPSLYTAVATDSNSGYVGIIRPALQSNRSTVGNLLRTDPDPKWINTAESVYVVGAFDIGGYVYYFFRELALESTAYCGKTYYSRVARVCKNDEGGSGLNMEYRFTSYLKARLVCSHTAPAHSIPQYFNDVHDVKYNHLDETFYALFMSNSNKEWGSAVCKYKLGAINNVFDEGAWIEQSKLESAWLRVPPEDVPKPRPGQCSAGSSSYITSTLSFIKSHPLMMDPINAEHGSPLYHSTELAFSRLEVDRLRDYTVLYLYSQELQELHRVAAWNDAENVLRSSPISVWKPFTAMTSAASNQNSVPTVWSLTFHSVKQKKWLYVTANEAVIQLSASQCTAYKYCSDCVRDPYCGWDVPNARCSNFQPGLLQSPTGVDSLSVCAHNNSCSKQFKHLGTVPGMAIEMNCSSYCRPDHVLDITWVFTNLSDETRGARTSPVVMDSNHALTTSGSLVILRVSAVKHTGSYQCLHRGIQLVQHTLVTSVCEYDGNIRDTFTKEYVKWCKVFDEYHKDYERWRCMKKKCIEKNCLPDVRDCGS